MQLRVSLANKCLLLFGGAVVLIVLAALTPPWFRMNALVEESQLELSRQLVSSWMRSPAAEGADAEARIRRMGIDEARDLAENDAFVRRALRAFEREPGRMDFQRGRWLGPTREFSYARAERRAGAGDEPVIVEIILATRQSLGAARLLIVNTLYLLSAGSFVLALAVLVFYLVSHKLILAPVRSLKQTAELVREGNLTERSDIETGDEFQELSETFNSMLGEVQRSQEQLRAINAAMDIKLNELAESNVALHESTRLKGEFLASVSHELRTPLNSIIGFTELLLEIAAAEAAAGDDSTRLQKRTRYLENILASGRNLLDMINGLLEMARIEAGKFQLHPEKIVLSKACEALVGLIHPVAAKRGLDVRLEVSPDVPVIETDAKRFQQIVFNFLSNAVKFTEPDPNEPAKPRITLRAERLPAPLDRPDEPERVRVSVIDSGPGIAPEDQKKIFEKFQQLDTGHTRQHSGTGLGLAISKELASLLQGEIQLVSELGRGSMFSLILPVQLDPNRAAEVQLESAFRGALAGRRQIDAPGPDRATVRL